jgi:tRNA modification GTPase
MFSPTDTIVAIATPPGRGGIGVVRISGAQAQDVALALLGRRRGLRPRYATLARFVPAARSGGGDGAGGRPGALDQVIATFYPAGASYTGDDLVEISAHGSPVVLRSILEAATAAGARLAEPGEFTLRAFLAKRIDLVQAEAVNDLVEAATPSQARAAFDQLEGTLTQSIAEADARLFELSARLEASIDFPEEGYHFGGPAEVSAGIDEVLQRIRGLLASAARGRLIREGRQVVILGKPNVGKSSLFNYLVGANRAIVSGVPGTTRDLITEQVEIDGLRVGLVDTAGITVTSDPVEKEGVVRAQGSFAVAHLTLVVLDRSEALDEDDRKILHDTSGSPRVLVINKCDLPAAWVEQDLGARGETVLSVSLRTQEGTGRLSPAIVHGLGGDARLRDEVMVTNVRHVRLLEVAEEALAGARAALARDATLSEEFVLSDLDRARAALEEITGKRTKEEMLQEIFSRFCIGK